MLKIDYPRVIKEDQGEVEELEKRHRYSHLFLVSQVHERGPIELVTEEAWQELEEAMKEGKIVTIAQAHRFLNRGIDYAHPESVGVLLRRRKVKLQTRRPRHEEADLKEQEAFKKLRWQEGGSVRTNPRPSH